MTSFISQHELGRTGEPAGLMRAFKVCLLLALWLGYFAVLPRSDAQTGAPQKETFEKRSLLIPDVVLTNEHGERVHLPDVLRHRVSVINTVFTTCTTICLPLGANFGKLEKLLESRAGSDVILVSISLDPVTDTPERLLVWGRKFGAGSGWTLLTGEKRQVDTALKALGAYTADKVQHTPTVIIGWADSGEWVRTNGLARVTVLASIVNNLLAAHTERKRGE